MAQVPNQEDEMPVPLNTRMIHHIPTSHNHNIVIPAYSCPQIIHSDNPIMASTFDHNFKKMVTIKYKECMKNHAIGVGGNATDGCGEFLPDGEEGTIEALSCSACQCHRNFHRKEIDADDQPSSENCHCQENEYNPKIGRNVLFVGHQNLEFLDRNELEYQAGTLIPSRNLARVPHLMGGAVIPSELDEQEEPCGVAAARPNQVVKKRFRTKFTQEQKEKLQDFAEKVGWKIQKLEESAVQSFCQEVGVNRRVLRVWMLNNKHSFAKKNNQPNDQN
ncbi:zinc-finger homeodomain protein 4-like [Primulina tabacum]|uniref:zinc-finger homeodomain protein 4-like n=1 Tax=Primulina tabacum TaxID=48773 RepID=UPI003F59B89B